MAFWGGEASNLRIGILKSSKEKGTWCLPASLVGRESGIMVILVDCSRIIKNDR